MNKKFIHATIFVLALGVRAEVSRANDCFDVDLRDQLSTETPYHQGNTKLCYAVVTADLLSAKLGEKIDPMDVVVQAVSTSENFLTRGGMIVSAVDVLSRTGVCRQESSSLRKRYANMDLLAEALKENKAAKSLAQASCVQKLSIGAGSVDLIDSSQFWSVSSSSKERQEMVFDRVDQLLGNDRKILAVTYYSDDCVFCTPGFHVVSLVGRYMNRASGQCMYVLRNSYGTYDESPNYFGVFAKEGYIHMPREQALKKFTRIEYLR